LFIVFQYRYKKLVAIILPNSNELAIIAVAQKLPENKRAMPLTEKNPPQIATNKALRPSKVLNMFLSF
jgi:hypothetical protein